MEIFISIDGVLRNTIQKFNYHYDDAFLLTEPEEGDTFEYGVTYPIQNNNLPYCYKFQSIDQFNSFFYIEYALEIFGHGGLSYKNVISNLNTLISQNPEHNFTLVGLDELGKARPSTLFFLAKNACSVNNVKFIRTDKIEDVWKTCDYWVTDNEKIINSCPEGKTVVKFNTDYNSYFTNIKEISTLLEIEETWLKSLEKPTTLISMELPKSVE